MAKITGNKGEWSELYAFLRLLATGELYAADDLLQKIKGQFFPVLEIKRGNTLYKIRDKTVEIYLSAKKTRTYHQDEMAKYADAILNGINTGGDRAFEIGDAYEIMSNMECEQIKAPSTDKSDIVIRLHDIMTGYERFCGFSIKSDMGNSPTLLNASKATNFVFRVDGISKEEKKRINAINTRHKLIDRVCAIKECGTVKYIEPKDKIFWGNLQLIDSFMDEIIAYLLLDYYSGGPSSIKDLTERIENKNPLNYPRKGVYEYKIKKLLCATALGMLPSTEWNGRDEANGGYIIVKSNGDVLTYHIYNRDAFEQYLLNNTKLEKGSSDRHDFAKIYDGQDDKCNYVNLNLQIRFK